MRNREKRRDRVTRHPGDHSQPRAPRSNDRGSYIPGLLRRRLDDVGDVSRRFTRGHKGLPRPWTRSISGAQISIVKLVRHRTKMENIGA